MSLGVLTRKWEHISDPSVSKHRRWGQEETCSGLIIPVQHIQSLRIVWSLGITSFCLEGRFPLVDIHVWVAKPRWPSHETIYDTSFKCIVLIFLASGFGKQLLTFLQCLMTLLLYFANCLFPAALLPKAYYFLYALKSGLVSCEPFLSEASQ